MERGLHFFVGMVHKQALPVQRDVKRQSDSRCACVEQMLGPTDYDFRSFCGYWASEEMVSKVSVKMAHKRLCRVWKAIGLAVSAVMLSWIFYATAAEMLGNYRLPTPPIEAVEPFRIANRYGLFAVMTRGRYEIEFQGSDDGENWKPYHFRYKPQELNQRPRIYAPYQPRSDWNLWFASLGSWREYRAEHGCASARERQRCARVVCRQSLSAGAAT